MPRVARALAELGWVPDLVLCSDAERTRETLVFLEETLERELPSRVTNRLYLADVRVLLGVIAEAPAEVARLMVLGHNPGCEDLVLNLTGDEILFWDDSAANVACARDCGWHAEQYTDFGEFQRIMPAYDLKALKVGESAMGQEASG